MKQTQTLMESMTSMFPTTVIKLKDPATVTIRKISTVVYGLAENMLALFPLVLADRNELSILSRFPDISHRRFRSSLYLEKQKGYSVDWFVRQHGHPGQTRHSLAANLQQVFESFSAPRLAKDGQVSK